VLEGLSGWSIVSVMPSSGIAAGPLLIMSYRGDLRISFYPKRFRVPNSEPQSILASVDAPLELTMTAPTQLSPIKSLVLSCLRSNLGTIQPSIVTPKQLLHFLSQAWNLGLSLEEEIRVLEFCGVTKPKLIRKGAQASLKTRCIVLGDLTSVPGTAKLARHKGRIDVDIIITPHVRKTTGDLGKFELDSDVVVSKVYGFGSDNSVGMSETQMRDLIWKIIENKNNSHLELETSTWGKAVRELAAQVFL
jgi:kinetochore protein Spc7/SPC105